MAQAKQIKTGTSVVAAMDVNALDEDSNDKDQIEFDANGNIMVGKEKLRAIWMNEELSKICINTIGTTLEWAGNDIVCLGHGVSLRGLVLAKICAALLFSKMVEMCDMHDLKLKSKMSFILKNNKQSL